MVATFDAGQQEIAEQVVRRALTLDEKECSTCSREANKMASARTSNGLLSVYGVICLNYIRKALPRSKARPGQSRDGPKLLRQPQGPDKEGGL